MNISPVELTPLAAGLAQGGLPRVVDAASREQFSTLMADPGSNAAPAERGAAAGQVQQALGIDMDIERVLMANLPAANASPAEFAMGMLRAQVKVSQAAIAIEMVSKTTQTLTQGVQSLATRS